MVSARADLTPRCRHESLASEVRFHSPSGVFPALKRAATLQSLQPLFVISFLRYDLMVTLIPRGIFVL